MGESLRDRLAALSRRELAALVGVVLIGLAGVGLWYMRSLPQPVALGTTQAGTVRAAASPSPTVIVVHVAGWVRHPGVYEFEEGDRVVDAVNAAGGPRKNADLDSLNLAALLTDGEQILVYRSASGGAVAPAAAPTGSPGAAGAKININTASATELEALPGIGEVLGQAIVDYRTENGPFTTVDQLEDVSGIGPSTLEDVRDLVTV